MFRKFVVDYAKIGKIRTEEIIPRKHNPRRNLGLKKTAVRKQVEVEVMK